MVLSLTLAMKVLINQMFLWKVFTSRILKIFVKAM